MVSRSLVLGRTAGLATAVGDNLGKIVQVVVVAFGAGVVLEQSIVVFNVVKVAGAAYLVYLGV
ncbi:MAG TPA: LysE family transporter, partial [Candidatus Dormibacteraeota bacterium]|nr:LysE family transporter [Candidatus Dormibacteraeota bacterium]